MNITSWHSYPSIYNVGHRYLEPLIQHEVNAEEKVDGSQFSFGRFNGVLKVKSKNQELFPETSGMFNAAVQAVSKLDLHDGWTYRGEYLQKPKHNTLTYGRIPNNHVILFDVNIAEESYLDYPDKKQEADRIGIECVPLLYHGVITTERLMELLESESILGGTKVEGVVLKNYSVFGQDKKVLMGKFVSESFKERHSKCWKEANPGRADVLDNIITQLRTEARWDKSIYHLRDAGELENDPRDIGKLMKELNTDLAKEETEWIKDQLFKWAWGNIARGVQRGFPEYYKTKIAAEQLG